MNHKSDITTVEQHGWTFHPSTDVKGPQGFSDIATPECWTHEYHPTQFDIGDVLEIINNEIELEIERNLT